MAKKNSNSINISAAPSTFSAGFSTYSTGFKMLKNFSEIQKSGPDSFQRRLTRRGHLWCAATARFVLALQLILLVVHDDGTLRAQSVRALDAELVEV